MTNNKLLISNSREQEHSNLWVVGDKRPVCGILYFMNLKQTQRQKKRKKVFEKFNGKCAYSGLKLPLDKWEIDHLNPLPRGSHGVRVIDSNTIDNLMPTFKFINMFKKNKNLNEWRFYLMNIHKRLGVNIINGKDVRFRAKHKEKLLSAFKISKDSPFNGIFYFETKKEKTKRVKKLPVYKNVDIKNIKGEIWQPVKKYKSYYLVSNMGRIKCVLRVDLKGQTRRSIIKKQQISKDGYLVTLFSADKVRRTERVDIIVAETFISNPGNYKCVFHKNGNKLDIRACNLYWGKKSKV